MSNTTKPKSGMGAIGKVFAGMEIVDGAKKTRDEFRNTENVYDDKLGVSMKGFAQPKMATDELDDLIKMAGAKGHTVRTAKEAIKRGGHNVGKKIKNGLTSFDEATARNAKATVDAIGKKDIKGALKSGVKALPGVAANTGAIAGATIGTAKALDALDKKNTDENKAAHKLIGATVGAGLAATSLTGGGIYQGSKIIKDTIKKSLIKHPSDQFAKSNATYDSIRKTMKSTINDKGVGDAIKDIDKVKKKAVQAQRDAAKNNAKASQNVESSAQRLIGNINKNLNTENEKYKKTMVETLRGSAAQEQENFVNKFMMKNKGATVDDARKAWKTSTEKSQFDKASRLAAGTSKRINKQAGDELDGLLKLAGFDAADLKSAVKPVIKGVGKAGEYALEKIITPSITAMSTTAAPVIATTLLSQRMMNQAKEEKEEAQAQAQAQAQPAAQPQTLVIKIDGSNAYPEKTAADDQSHDIGNVLENVIGELNEIKGAEKLRTERVHVGNGRKKLFRMQEQHGMDGMQP